MLSDRDAVHRYPWPIGSLLAANRGLGSELLPVLVALSPLQGPAEVVLEFCQVAQVPLER